MDEANLADVGGRTDARRPVPRLRPASIPGATCRTRTTVGTTASRRCWRWSSARAMRSWRRWPTRSSSPSGPGLMTRQPLVARRAEELLGSSVVATAPVAGGDIATATRLRLSDGQTALMKTLPHAPDGLLRGRGRRSALARRGRRRRAACPRCSAPTSDCLILRVGRARAKTPVEAAVTFGQQLAATHAAGADGWGLDHDGFIGRLPLPNRTGRLVGGVLRRPPGAALPQAGPRPRRDHRRGRGRRRGRRRPAHRAGPRRAARPAARRPVERQLPLGPRPRHPRDRPGGLRRAPRGRPGDAAPLRAAAPAAGVGGLRRGAPARRRLGGPARHCTSSSRCSCTPACSVAATAPGPATIAARYL